MQGKIVLLRLDRYARVRFIILCLIELIFDLGAIF